MYIFFYERYNRNKNIKGVLFIIENEKKEITLEKESMIKAQYKVGLKNKNLTDFLDEAYKRERENNYE